MPKDQNLSPNLNDYPLEERVSFRISRLHARLNMQAARLLKASAQIGISQWRIMVLIERDREVTASEIVRKTRIDKALISRTIKSMVEDGLLQVDVNNRDQREHLIRFSAKGAERFEEALPHMLARHNGLISGLTEIERETFFKVMTKIEDAIDRQESRD